jgi:plasmid stabilization system protein ParE
MNGFELSPAARQDLHAIWDHIAQDSMDAANRFRDRLYAAILKLVAMPGMGHRHEALADETLRVWPVRSYLIIYRPDTQPLQIVRVVSGYRDLPALFES